MERTFWPIAVLCLLVYRCRGIDLDILVQPPDSLVDNWCGLLQCSEQAGGGLVTIDSLTVFKKSSTGADQLVAELSFDYPFIDSEEGSMKIEGSMDAKGVKANIKIELKEQADCEAEFTCKVLGKDGSSGAMVISSTEKGLARGDASASNLAPVRYLANLISQSVNRLYLVLETKVLSFGERVNEMEELVKGSGRTIDKKLNVSIKQLQDHIDTKIHELERKLPPKSDGKDIKKRESDPQSLSKLESDSKDIQKRQSDPQSLSKLELTISSAFSRFSNEAKANITSHLDTLTFWFRNNQSEILANLSEQSAASLANASDLLQLVNEDFKKREGLDQVVLSTVKTELEAIRDALTTTEIKAVCMLNDTFDSDQNVECYRYMSAYRPIPFPQYIQTHDKLLNQTILCDTKARSGGWIIIQRRVDFVETFFRPWADYKKGFGDVTGDFWLGNDAIHNLTSAAIYELRIDMTVDKVDMFAAYSSFKIESEEENYKVRLGTYFGTIGVHSHESGLINNVPFSTWDSEHDEDSEANCAKKYSAGWWYKTCNGAELNGQRGQGFEADRLSWGWTASGQDTLYPTFTEMKIRKL